MKMRTILRVLTLTMTLTLILPFFVLRAEAISNPIAVSVGTNEFTTANVGGEYDNSLLRILGTSTVTAGAVHLTNIGNQAGSIIKRDQVKLKDGFSTYFELDLDNSDGMAFVIYKAEEPKLGLMSAYLGYGHTTSTNAITNSIVVEFDTYGNVGTAEIPSVFNDPAGSHVSIMLDGNKNHATQSGSYTENSVATAADITAKKINVWVDYQSGNGSSTDGTVTVTFGTGATRADIVNRTITRIITVADVAAGAPISGNDVFVGFTAGTFNSANTSITYNYELTKWYFNDSYVLGGLNSSGVESYTQAASTISITTDIYTTAPSVASIIAYDVSGKRMATTADVYVDDILKANNISLSSTTDGANGGYSYIFEDALEPGLHRIRVVTAGGGSNFLDFTVNANETSLSDYVDLKTWSDEWKLNGLDYGDWVVASGGSSVVQKSNGNSTAFLSPDNYIDKIITGTIKVAPDTIYNDLADDIIGFVMGYKKTKDEIIDTDDEYEFIIFDWKGPTQGDSKIGYYLWKYNGVLSEIATANSQSFWLHTLSSDRYSALAPGATQATGWDVSTEYEFSILYTSDRIKIVIDGITIYDVLGNFNSGKFGFYNRAQSNVIYSNVLIESIAPTDTWDNGGTISTAAELAQFSFNVNHGKTYIDQTITLNNDIDLSVFGRDWIPIGKNINSNGEDYFFRGTFDGKGYTIIGLNIGTSDTPNTALESVGLFGAIGTTATIKNLGLDNTTIHSSKTSANIGGLVGRSYGKITNSYVKNSVFSVHSTANVGGLVGLNSNNSILNSYASTTITGGLNVGGLIGSLASGSINNGYYQTLDAISGNVISKSVVEIQSDDFVTTLNNNLDSIADKTLYLWQTVAGNYPEHTNILWLPAPVSDDFTISGLSSTYDGTGKSVSILPNSGKSTGAVTIKYNGSTTVPTDAGSYLITFDVAADANYAAVSGLSGGTLEIGKATLTAQAENKTIKIGAGLPTYTVLVTGFVNGEVTGTADGYQAPTLSCSAIDSNTITSYTITATGGSATNYTFNYASGTLTVSDLDISSVEFDSDTITKVYGDDGFTITPTKGGSTNAVVYTSSNPSTATVVENSGQVIITGAGTTVITATVDSDGSYSSAENNYILTVDKAPITITDPTVTTIKRYDGSTNAAMSMGTPSGVISGDEIELSVQATASYDDANVGLDKTITVVYTLVGEKESNYLAPVDFITTGRIRIALSDIETTPISTDPSQETEDIINGDVENLGTQTKSLEDGKSVVTLIVEESIVQSKIDEALKENLSDVDKIIQITIVENTSVKAKVELSGDIIKKLYTENFSISVKHDNVECLIPANQFNIANGSGETAIENIKYEIQITKVDESEFENYSQMTKAKGAQLLLSPVSFEVISKTTNDDGNTTEVSITKFSNFIELIMEIPDSIDPKNITTGVVFNEDGSYSHIPTVIYEKDGKWYAKLNSLSNSKFSVISNPVTVKSVENHWSKESVNDMAARLDAFDTENFTPEKVITRADLTEYIVMALGLYREGIEYTKTFSDVATNEFAISIAKEYGIVSGYQDGTFRPDELVTREQAMVMIQRAMNITNLVGADEDRYQNYNDYNDIANWAKPYAKEVLSAHIFNGINEMILLPKSNLTIAEAVSAIKNLLVESNLINN